MTHKNLNILLVEDNPGDARYLQEILKTHELTQYNIEHVTTLLDALQVIKIKSFDIVILDLGLPDSKGFDTFNKINNQFTDGPIIVLTGNNDDELGSTLVRLGAQDFLIKGSYEVDLLYKSIEYAIDRFNTHKIIERNEIHFREIIEKNADGMIVTSKDGIVLYVNPVAEKLFQKKSVELEGKSLGFDIDEKEVSEEQITDSDGNKRILQLKIVDAIWDNKNAKILTLRDITELKENQNRINRLNKFLKTISSVNHLIVVEKNRKKLLQDACRLLTKGRNYGTAWIGILNEQNQISEIVSSGYDNKFKEFQEHINSCQDIYCLVKILESESVVYLSDTSEICNGCPLAKLYTKKAELAVKISHENKNFGILVVSHSSGLIYNSEEGDLLEEVAADLGLALHSLKIESKNKKAQEKLLWLNEAVKEAANAVLLTNKDGVIEWANPAFTKLTGYELEEVIGKKTSILRSGKQDANLYTNLWQSILAGNIWKGEVINKKKDGTLYTEEMTITPVKNSQGIINRFIAIKSDVSERKASEKKIIESERRYRSLYENSSLAIYRTTTDGKLLMANPAYNRMLGLDVDKGNVDRHNYKVAYVNPQDREIFINTLNKEGKITGFETAYLHSDGSILYVRENAIAVKDEKGNVLYFEGTFEDITSKVLAEKALLESEEKFRGFFEHSTIGFYQSTPDGKILYANDELVRLLGYKSMEDLLNLVVQENYPIQSQKEEFDRIMAKDGQIRGFESVWLKADGTPLYIRENAVAVKDERGKIIYYEGFLEDITNHVRTEKALKESEERYRSLYENAVIGIYRVDSNWNITTANPAFMNMLEFGSLDQLKNKNFVTSGIADCVTRNRFRDILKREGVIYGFESVWNTKSGKEIVVTESAKAIYSESMEILYFEGIAYDVTIQKEAEKKIRESEELFRSLYENSTIGFYRTTPEGKIIMANPVLNKIMGYTSETDHLRNRNITVGTYANPADKLIFDELMKNEGVVKGFETKYIRADGVIIFVRENARVVRDSDGKILYYEGSIEDISEKKNAEIQIQKSEKQFRTIWESSFDGMRLTDENGIVVQVNDAFCKLLGLERDQLVGQYFNVAYLDRNEKSLEKYRNNFESGNIKTHLETKVLLKDNKFKWISLSNSLIQVGKDKLLLSIFRDITEAKENEHELMIAKEKAEKSDRLKSEFLAQMSHEIRTPLNAILSFTELLKYEVEGKVEKDIYDSFGIIDSSGRRIIRTIDLILNMSQLQTGTFLARPVELHFCNDIVHPIFKEYEIIAREKKLEFRLIDECKKCIVNFDDYCAHQIVSNLIDNAIKFTDSGSVIVRVKENRNYLEFFVEDTGIGISQEYLPKLFDPFTQEQHGYTREYDGNGLGLTLVKKYCELNNAKIDVKSEKGKGSTFTISLPKQ